MAEFFDRINNPAPHASKIWVRRATPREARLGIRTDGTIKTICSSLLIVSPVEIVREIIEICADYFNRNMFFLNEFLMEKEETKDIWLVQTTRNQFIVEELEHDYEIIKYIIEEEINSKIKAKDIPNWKLYYSYVGNGASGNSDSWLFHKYQFIFVFSTGTLDEVSCALLCNLFIIILDCAIEDAPFERYSHLDMYDIGSKLEAVISTTIEEMRVDERYHNWAKRDYEELVNNPCSSFKFTKKNFENRDTPFKTMKCIFSADQTIGIMDMCHGMNIGIYAFIIVVVNYVLLYHAERNSFKGTFRARVLHMVNARYILFRVDRTYLDKLGSHFLPFMQDVKLESTESEELFKEISRVEKHLDKVTKKEMLWEHESLKEISIKQSGTKYNSGEWNSNYCFSATNLGNLDLHYNRDTLSIKVLSYERNSSLLEGGYLDVVFYTFRNRLNVHFDFSNEYFNNDEMLTMVKLFSRIMKGLF